MNDTYSNNKIIRLAGYEHVKLYDDSFIDWYGRRFPLE